MKKFLIRLLQFFFVPIWAILSLFVFWPLSPLIWLITGISIKKQDDWSFGIDDKVMKL